MADIAERLALLTPHGPRLDGGGRGGIPDLTPQDIAAALGMTPAGIGRDLLWWHYADGSRACSRRAGDDGPVHLSRALDEAIATLVAAQRRQRLHRRVDAQVNLDLVRELAQHSRRTPDDVRYRIARLSDEYQRARDACWPGDSPAWPHLRRAVVHELGGPTACRRCNGRGHLVADDLTITCTSCDGAGRKSASGRLRARWLRVNEHTYRHEWRSPYESIYATLRDAMQTAAHALDAAAA